MAGSGVALRLHEFKEFLHCEHNCDGQNRASRQGRDTYGLYPGQVGRVHAAHAGDYGWFDVQSGRSQGVSEPHEDHYLQSFDVRALQVLSVCPKELLQRPLQTTYQEHFGLQSLLTQRQSRNITHRAKTVQV